MEIKLHPVLDRLAFIEAILGNLPKTGEQGTAHTQEKQAVPKDGINSSVISATPAMHYSVPNKNVRGRCNDGPQSQPTPAGPAPSTSQQGTGL